MGWLHVLISITASFLLYKTGSKLLFIIAVIATIGSFWSWGIMHNYATNRAKKRLSYRGGFYDLTEKEIVSVPNWITRINMMFAFLGLILLIIAVIKII
jgi:hypothetical protein